MTRINQTTKLLLAVPAALAIASCSATEDTTADTAANTGGMAPTVTASIGGDGAETVSQERTQEKTVTETCLLYTSPSPRDATLSRMPSSA